MRKDEGLKNLDIVLEMFRVAIIDLERYRGLITETSEYYQDRDIISKEDKEDYRFGINRGDIIEYYFVPHNIAFCRTCKISEEDKLLERNYKITKLI